MNAARKYSHNSRSECAQARPSWRKSRLGTGSRERLLGEDLQADDFDLKVLYQPRRARREVVNRGPTLATARAPRGVFQLGQQLPLIRERRCVIHMTARASTPGWNAAPTTARRHIVGAAGRRGRGP